MTSHKTNGRPRRHNGDKRTTTKVAKFLAALDDQQWHSTRELVRRIGHTFGGAKFKAVHLGYAIATRRHPSLRHQWQYRLTDRKPGPLPVRYDRSM